MMSVVVTSEEQPDLWPEWPSDPLLVEKIRGASFLRTGKIISKQMERCRAVCLDIVYGRATGLLSDRAIAQKHRISRNDLGTVVSIMHARGELEPLAKAINAQLDMNTWLTGMRIQEGLLSGEIHPGQLPIAWCAMFDKKSQRDAGMVVGTERTVAAVTAEHIILEQEMMRRKLLASEVESVALPAIAEESCMSGQPDTGMDTTPVPAAEVSGPTSDGSLAPAGGLETNVEVGGGGIGLPAGTGDSVGMDAEHSGPKDS